MSNKLIIISNESVHQNNGLFYCDNLDHKSLPEGFSKNFEVTNIARKSKIKREHKINLNNTIVSANLFIFLLNVFRTFKKKEAKYLVISITPYTFFASLLLIILKKNFFVYLRSDGYEEYKQIIGDIGKFLYHIMFTVVSWKANFISCRTHILKKKNGKIVSPSQLSKKWFESHKKPNLEKVKLLYIGRIKIEKGVFSLLNIIKNLDINFQLTIVGAGFNNNVGKKIEQKNVSIINFKNTNDSIIEFYDKHNIFILPSFTEGHPQVLDEALSRLRPVIIFEEISHVIGNRKGVFISKRDPLSLSKQINHIMNNYSDIVNEIMKNNLPTKDSFLEEMNKIIQSN